MATWGKLKISIEDFDPENNTVYYEYNTTSDQYYFEVNTKLDYGLGYEDYKSEYRFSPEIGEGLMEAFINHLLNFECSGDEDLFIERYIKNNKFKKAQER
jgi:hypothetical protein